MSDKIIGTCSKCGGAVALPTIWHGTEPPVPTCKNCGATKRQPHGAIIDMEGGDGSKSHSAKFAAAMAYFRSQGLLNKGAD